ncbi:MAG: sulfite exporter TauE/SafE family protein [Chloroflexi bacterium]|nr:MAG: sulfite exporter TauE/SafE family protein [Chloroflexota bacterium]
MGALQLLTLVVGLSVAGLAKGATAMGLPLIATPILASVFGPKQAVVIITIPIFVANTLLLLQSWRVLGYLRTLLPLVIANAAGTALGALLLVGLDQRTFAILITAMVVLFLARGDRLVGDPGARRARVLTPVVGFVGGVMQGTTSISSPVIGSFFHALRLPPKEYVITLASVFQLSSIVQLVSYTALGLFTPDLFTLGVVACIPMLLALMAGIAIRGRLDQVRFRQVIVVLLVASVGNLLWRTFLA